MIEMTTSSSIKVKPPEGDVREDFLITGCIERAYLANVAVSMASSAAFLATTASAPHRRLIIRLGVPRNSIPDATYVVADGLIPR
jgi:hypothetical protein